MNYYEIARNFYVINQLWDEAKLDMLVEKGKLTQQQAIDLRLEKQKLLNL